MTDLVEDSAAHCWSQSLLGGICTADFLPLRLELVIFVCLCQVATSMRPRTLSSLSSANPSGPAPLPSGPPTWRRKDPACVPTGHGSLQNHVSRRSRGGIRDRRGFADRVMSCPYSVLIAGYVPYHHRYPEAVPRPVIHHCQYVVS